MPYEVTIPRRRRSVLPWVFCFFVLSIHGSTTTTTTAKKVPEVSSTLLQMHRLYLQQPPHDRTLYNILEISPNATAADITKAYRRLSRRYHPDKQQQATRQRHKNNNDNDDAKEQLEKVQEAYEILKDDATRLPYHRYGLTEPSHAVLVLTGRGLPHDDPRVEKLLRIMGYTTSTTRQHGKQTTPDDDDDGDDTITERERITLLATDLLEQIRPVVEGRISRYALLEQVAADCDMLKGLPLGAQIVRCIGRAYKHAGQRYLRQMAGEESKRKTNTLRVASIPEGVRDGFRQGKLWLTAAGWWGRALWSERCVARAQQEMLSSSATITYHGWKDHFGELTEPHDSAHYRPPTHDEIRKSERQKAQKALLESTQVEALWKICKIDLYRTVREACDLILSRRAFFYHLHTADGWVGSTGETVDTALGLYRAALVLRAMGDVMVERSKEGTAWME